MNIDFILDFLYPKRCPICDGVIGPMDAANGFCKDCYKKLPFIEGRRCYKCGRAIADPTAEFCLDCMKKGMTHKYDKGLSLFTYDDSLRYAMYRLKYGGRSEYAAVFGKNMALRFGKALKRAGADGVIAVPLHAKRMAVRGYNQAELLAEAFSKYSQIPFYRNYILRTQNTKPLKSMSRTERQNNLKKAFKIGRNDVKLKITIVIDDIYTTGSTLDAVSGVLKDAGVQRIYFLTVAIGGDR